MNKIENFEKSSRGSLLYLIETAYTVMGLLGHISLANTMKEQVLKCKTDKEVEELLIKYEKQLEKLKLIEPFDTNKYEKTIREF